MTLPQHRSEPAALPRLTLVSASPSLGDIAAYVQALKDHDWEYQFSDEHAVYQRGFNGYSNLKRVQKRIDAEGTLWNTVAPEAYRLLVVEAGEVL
jgi:hypothetical protein